MTLKLGVRIVPANSRHITTIANRMRAADRVEVEAFGQSPKQAMRKSFVQSEVAWTALVGGKPEAMFGLVVASAIEGRGLPWFLGTEEVYRHGRDMIMHGPAILARLLDSTPQLENLVSAGNGKAIRLLKRWGFDVDSETECFGGVPFHQFRMLRYVSSRRRIGHSIDCY